ncbi:IS5 family transposase [Lacticaseibacillus chiayiensis]|uniref:IS5 family transposase n=1 Tax=Lacticaseibacillus chiayiensis TaxID=2100821 RepID=UPI001EE0D6BD|nr:IS5 family transposase [Lacticaseibacillus chiayiensis]
MNTPKRYELSDEQWDQLATLFPSYPTGRPSKLSNKTAFNANLWLLKSGAARVIYRNAMCHGRQSTTVFVAERTRVVFEKAFTAISDDPDMENISLDSTSIHVHQKATGAKNVRCIVENQAIGMSRGGRTTKIHAIVDGLGNPLRFLLTGVHIHDSQAAQPLLVQLELAGVNVIADKAYDAKHLRDYIDTEHGSYTITPKASIKEKWDCDYHVYWDRHLIESLFNQVKNCIRLATRYNKLAPFSWKPFISRLFWYG